MQRTQMSMIQKVELLKQVGSNPMIPSPPTVVLNVLDKASRPDCTIGDLCQIIQMDPGLAANILRIVNSATFGLSRTVTSIQRALTVVGLNSARLLVLAIAFPKMHSSLKMEPALKKRYWKSSIVGAIAARELALRMGYRDAEDDMAAGLLRDLGELVLQQIFPEACAEMAREPEDAWVHSQCQIEEGFCGLDHAGVSAFILDRWRLPTEMTEAIRCHHTPDEGTFSSPKAEDRAYVLHFATRVAQFFLFPEQLSAYGELLEVARVHFAMPEEAVQEFLEPLQRKTAEFAALLQVDIGSSHDSHTILTRASEELVQSAIVPNRDSQRALEAVRRSERDPRRWKPDAAFDPLTKVFNRRYLENRLRDLLERPAGSRAFGLLFIDLDDFKLLNDRHGLAFGDSILLEIADCMSKEVRQDDIVARCGGDEFCILSEALDATTVQSLAQRVWERISTHVTRHGNQEGQIGASIGVVYCGAASRWRTPETFLKAADKAMRLAKADGKNRVIALGALDVLHESEG